MNKPATPATLTIKVLIVAKTRQGSGACIGAISADGRSLRLISADADKDEFTGREYEVGDVWEIHASPPATVLPPHTENIIVHQKRKLASQIDARATIERFMPPKAGGIHVLHEGLVQVGHKGTLYIAEKSGVPNYTTLFWRPDAPLYRHCDGKRIRYAYPTETGEGYTLAYVGFQDPVEIIPAGALVRVSLAHWWRPKDDPEIELRCYLQISGWFLPQSASLPEEIFQPASARKAASHTYESAQPAPPDEIYGTLDAPPEEEVLLYEPPRALPAFEASLAGATQLLKTVFGYDSFRPHQQEIIENVLDRRDTLVIMPTGGGKSLCFQIPALLFDGLTVVVSPLISLMKDQVDTLRELGVAAAFLNSTLSYNDDVSIRQHVRQGRIKLLYVAPETLLRPETLLLIEQSRLAAIAIDEAHCISEWGHDFRPEYRQLVALRHRFPDVVCVALTATATPKVQEDIKRQLRMLEQNTFVSSFDRPNLHLTVAPKSNVLQQTLDFLTSHRDQSGIIYCNTQRQVDQLSEALKAQGLSVAPYHAGLEDATRQRNQNAFIRDDVRVIVATVAFGMGIDKPDVRFVLHVDLPKDIENYYQQIGRGGRDGLPADCLLLYSYSDVNTILYFIREGAESEQQGRSHRLQKLVDWAESNECRRRPLLDYFGEAYTVENCAMCDNCQRGKQEQTDLTIAAQKFLSCVLRTGERFGMTHIINVLRGSRAKEVLSRGHEKLSTYGIGGEYSAEQWKLLARQMIRGGLMVQDLEFGQLKVLDGGRAVLKGEKFLGVLEVAGLQVPAASQCNTMWHFSSCCATSAKSWQMPPMCRPMSSLPTVRCKRWQPTSRKATPAWQ